MPIRGFVRASKEDPLGVSRVLGDQFVHERQRTGHAVAGGVVKRKAHAYDDGAWETLAHWPRAFGVVIAARVKQIGGNHRRLAAVEEIGRRGPQEDCKVPLRRVTYGLALRFGTPGGLVTDGRCHHSLLDAFAQIDDPRKPRGVRHPFTSMLALAFLGLLCRQTDFASLQRWAADHWGVLKGALGFTRKKPPHATTISRALAGSRSSSSATPSRGGWSRCRRATAVTVAVDGKTSKQGHDAQGDPVHMLNVFAHELGLCLAQFPVTDGKPTEPQALKAAMAELLDHYPMIRLFTGDALFTQRPLARVILEADRDFLFAVKDNQPDLHEAVQASFRDAAERPPDAQAVEKKGARSTPAGSGSWRARKSPTSVKRPRSPVSS